MNTTFHDYLERLKAAGVNYDEIEFKWRYSCGRCQFTEINYEDQKWRYTESGAFEDLNPVYLPTSDFHELEVRLLCRSSPLFPRPPCMEIYWL